MARVGQSVSIWKPIIDAPMDGSPVWARGRDWGKPDNPMHYGWVYWDGSNWCWGESTSGHHATYVIEFLPRHP